MRRAKIKVAAAGKGDGVVARSARDNLTCGDVSGSGVVDIDVPAAAADDRVCATRVDGIGAKAASDGPDTGPAMDFQESIPAMKCPRGRGEVGARVQVDADPVLKRVGGDVE